MRRTRPRAAVRAAVSLTLLAAFVEACALVASLDDHAPPAGGALADGSIDGAGGDDGGGGGGDGGASADAGDGAAGPKGLLTGAVDPSFTNGALAIGGDAGVDIVSLSADANDALVGLADVHVGTQHAWHLVAFSADGAPTLDRDVFSGTPYDSVLGADGRLYAVGVVTGFGAAEVFVPPFTPANTSSAAFSQSFGDPCVRVAFADDFVYCAGPTSTGVRLRRMDRGLQPAGLNLDGGSELVASGSVNASTPFPSVAVQSGVAYVVGDVNPFSPVAAAVAADGVVSSALAAVVGHGITVPVDVTTMAQAVVTAGLVDRNAGTSAGARILADGGADPGFAGDLAPLAAKGYVPSRLVVGSDGWLLVASSPRSGGAPGTLGAVARLRPDGSFDATFGAQGLATIAGNGAVPALHAACWQPAHKRLVVAGTDAVGSPTARGFIAAIK